MKIVHTWYKAHYNKKITKAFTKYYNTWRNLWSAKSMASKSTTLLFWQWYNIVLWQQTLLNHLVMSCRRSRVKFCWLWHCPVVLGTESVKAIFSTLFLTSSKRSITYISCIQVIVTLSILLAHQIQGCHTSITMSHNINSFGCTLADHVIPNILRMCFCRLVFLRKSW